MVGEFTGLVELVCVSLTIDHISRSPRSVIACHSVSGSIAVIPSHRVSRSDRNRVWREYEVRDYHIVACRTCCRQDSECDRSNNEQRERRDPYQCYQAKSRFGFTRSQDPLLHLLQSGYVRPAVGHALVNPLAVSMLPARVTAMRSSAVSSGWGQRRPSCMGLAMIRREQACGLRARFTRATRSWPVVCVLGQRGQNQSLSSSFPSVITFGP